MARGWARASGAAAALAVLAFGAPVLAQTCRGAPPSVGQTVTGPVIHVIDGKTLCIAQGPTPDHWIALLISPSVTPLPADRERLMAASFSRSLTCKVTGRRGPLSAATCTLDGQSLESLLSVPATVTEAKAWR
jgi:hypothetical protein